VHTCALAFVSLLTLVPTTVFGVEKKRRKVDQDDQNEEVASERRSIREKRKKERKRCSPSKAGSAMKCKERA